MTLPSSPRLLGELDHEQPIYGVRISSGIRTLVDSCDAWPCQPKLRKR